VWLVKGKAVEGSHGARLEMLLHAYRATGDSEVTVVIRWDEKAGLRTGCGVRFQVIDVSRDKR